MPCGRGRVRSATSRPSPGEGPPGTAARTSGTVGASLVRAAVDVISSISSWSTSPAGGNRKGIIREMHGIIQHAVLRSRCRW